MDANTSLRNKPDHERISLSSAARRAPGSPSPNCIWRWCRRGVKARTGERIRLQDERIGGKLYTSERWIREFGQRLAAADQRYFEQRDAESPPSSETTPRPAQRARRLDCSARSQSGIESQLNAEGL